MLNKEEIKLLAAAQHLCEEASKLKGVLSVDEKKVCLTEVEFKKQFNDYLLEEGVYSDGSNRLSAYLDGVRFSAIEKTKEKAPTEAATSDVDAHSNNQDKSNMED
jgi:hypothetical protein